MSKFLENLKDSLEKGEFNSEAAQKINEISELTEKKLKDGQIKKTEEDLEEVLNERLMEGGIKTVSEEEATEINQEYEKRLEEIKRVDAINKEIALLIEIEDAVNATINDMSFHIEDVEEKYADDIENKNPIVAELVEKINKIKEKFKSIIN